jgi:hypothetical protein
MRIYEKYLTEENLIKDIKKSLGKSKVEIGNVIKTKDKSYVVITPIWPETPRNIFFKLKDKFKTNIVGDHIQVWVEK